jgi:hypothetical protein
MSFASTDEFKDEGSEEYAHLGARKDDRINADLPRGLHWCQPADWSRLT